MNGAPLGAVKVSKYLEGQVPHMLWFEVQKKSQIKAKIFSVVKIGKQRGRIYIGVGHLKTEKDPPQGSGPSGPRIEV